MLISFLFAQSLAWGATQKSLLEDGSHCVAYKAEKVTFFFASGTVIGRNCDISAQVLPEVGGLYHIEVNVPVSSFQSGDAGRDEDVRKLLKGDTRSDLVFRTKALTAEKWHDLFATKDFDLEGELQIGEKTFPLKIPLRYSQTTDSAEVDGVVHVRFQDFNLTPPKVGGGILAKSKPEFELHFHLLASRILGADSIRLGGTDTDKGNKE